MAAAYGRFFSTHLIGLWRIPYALPMVKLAQGFRRMAETCICVHTGRTAGMRSPLLKIAQLLKDKFRNMNNDGHDEPPEPEAVDDIAALITGLLDIPGYLLWGCA